MERLRCVVERITYQNDTNGYAVIKCKAKGHNDLVTVVGAMPEVHVGSVLNLTGNWHIDAKYGQQFVIETFEETLAATVYGIEKYLGSGLVKGVGSKFAQRIVKMFGAETLNIIEDSPDELHKVPGIGKTRVERIKQSWQEQKEVKNIIFMNKAELIEAISTDTSLPKKDVDAVIKSFISTVSDTIQKKESVQLIGFGTFETSEREARTGRNPATGEEIQIAASTVVKFKAGSGLKEKVNKK